MRNIKSSDPTGDRKILDQLANEFAVQYINLPHVLSTVDCQRTKILKHLALHCGVSVEEIDHAVRNFRKVQDTVDPDVSLSHAAARVQRSATPRYEHVFQTILEKCPKLGLQLTLSCRRDIKPTVAYLQRAGHRVDTSVTDHADDDGTTQKELLVQLKGLDAYLQSVLSSWYSLSLLQLQRITYTETSAAVLEQIARNEAVHPVQSLEDLRRRLGSDRRVLCLVHPFFPHQPLIVVHVSLQRPSADRPDGIPDSISAVHEPDIDAKANDRAVSPTTAVFYSISNLEAGLAGIGLGEHLLKQTIQYLQSAVPSVQSFVTLSPMPTFRKWLQDRILRQRGSRFAVDDESSNLVGAEHLRSLSSVLGCPQEIALERFVQLLVDEGSAVFSERSSIDKTVFRNCLKRLAVHYVVNEKHRKQPLDPVSRFHLSNGAMVHRINVEADMSRRGWQNSFGVMANYLYELPLVEARKRNYFQQGNFPIEVDSTMKALLHPSESD